MELIQAELQLGHVGRTYLAFRHSGTDETTKLLSENEREAFASLRCY